MEDACRAVEGSGGSCPAGFFPGCGSAGAALRPSWKLGKAALTLPPRSTVNFPLTSTVMSSAVFRVWATDWLMSTSCFGTASASLCAQNPLRNAASAQRTLMHLPNADAVVEGLDCAGCHMSYHFHIFRFVYRYATLCTAEITSVHQHLHWSLLSSAVAAVVDTYSTSSFAIPVAAKVHERHAACVMRCYNQMGTRRLTSSFNTDILPSRSSESFVLPWLQHLRTSPGFLAGNQHLGIRPCHHTGMLKFTTSNHDHSSHQPTGIGCH
jgi:hypothetical protein